MHLRAEMSASGELLITDMSPGTAVAFNIELSVGAPLGPALSGIVPQTIDRRVRAIAQSGGKAFYPRCRSANRSDSEWFSLDCRSVEAGGIVLTFGIAIQGLPWGHEADSLNRALDWFPWPMQIFDQTGRLIGINAAFELAGAVNFEQVRDYNVLYDPASRREDIAGLIERLFGGELVRFDYGAGDSTGQPPRLFEQASPVLFPAWGFPILDEGGEVRAVVISYDEAGEAATTAGPRAREREFAGEIIDTADALIVCLDISGRITAFNPKCEATMGWKQEEVLGSFIWDVLIPPRYLGKIREVFSDLAGGNTAYLQMQNPWLTRDGRERMIFWHNAFHRGPNGKIDRITAVGIDITDQIRIEQQLRESEERYRSVTENLLTGVFIYQDDRFVYCNTRVEEILGLHRDQIIGRPVWEFVHSDDREMIRERAVRRQRGDPDLPDHYTFRVLHSSGETRWLELSVTTMDYQGRRAFLGNAMDITDRIAAEAERDALRRRLQQHQKMEALATLVGGIAHDFNNLLLAMMAGTSDVLAQTEPDDPRFKPLGDILLTSRRAKDLISQLLTIGSREPSAMTQLDLHEVIHEALRFVRPTLGDRIELRLSLAPTPALVMGDHSQLWQALTNLCLNARDAMLDGGIMDIATEVGREHVVVAITDTGKGIPAEIRDRIFEPFFTTKSRGIGTGLGLAVAYSAITSHGGTIEVTDRPGGGTTFRVQLKPLATAGKAASQSPFPAPTPQTAQVILVVDDEDGVRQVVSRILSREGHRVQTARDAQETMNVLRRDDAKFDLVILDLELPGRSGAEVLAEIRQTFPQLKVLLSSGQAPGPVVKQLLASGAVGFLQKPYDLWELRRAVKNAVGA